MCFSPEASFTSAGVLAVIGVATLKEAYPKQMAYLAFIPLIFAFQQFLEGIVWVTLSPNHYHPLLHLVSMKGFLIIASMYWPVWIPYTLYRLEPIPTRKRILGFCLIIGIVAAIAAGLSLLLLGNEVHIIAHHLAYPIPLKSHDHPIYSISREGYAIVLTLYVIATIGASLITSIRYVWIFGVLTLIAFMVAQVLYSHSFGSVWCFFAALISVVSYAIVRKSPPLS